MARPHIFEPLLLDGAGRCRLVNCTKGIVLAGTVETAFDSRARRTGLLGRDALGADAVLAIAPSNAVHTIGMRFPVDVLFITRAGRVTKRVLRLRPLRIAASFSAFAVPSSLRDIRRSRQPPSVIRWLSTLPPTPPEQTRPRRSRSATRQTLVAFPCDRRGESLRGRARPDCARTVLLDVALTRTNTISQFQAAAD